MLEFILQLVAVMTLATLASYLFGLLIALLELLEAWIARKKRDLESDKGDNDHA